MVAAHPVSITDTDDDVRVDFDDGSSGRYDLVVGADGVHSTMRRLLFGASGVRPSRRAVRAALPRPVAGRRTRVVVDGSGRGTVFLTIPIGDGKVYCYTDCRPGAARSPLTRPARRLRGTGADAARRGRCRHVHGAPMEEVTLPRWSRGAVLLIGDAAHATSPNMAEGAAMALEDAIVLADALAGERTITEALRAYEERRRVRTDWVLAQTHRRDRSRGLPPVIRNAVLRRTGRHLFATGYAPLHAQP